MSALEDGRSLLRAHGPLPPPICSRVQLAMRVTVLFAALAGASAGAVELKSTNFDAEVKNSGKVCTAAKNHTSAPIARAPRSRA